MGKVVVFDVVNEVSVVSDLSLGKMDEVVNAFDGDLFGRCDSLENGIDLWTK